MTVQRTREAATLAAQISRFIQGDRDRSFDALALAVHRWQHANDPVLRALTEQPPVDVNGIPAVPVALFKDLPVGTVQPQDAPVTFLTSGTTGGGRGAHRLLGTDLYDLGSLTWARACMGSIPTSSANLLLDPAPHPESSLSHMVALFAEASAATWHLHDDGLDLHTFIDVVRRASGPLFVGATAFALAEALSAGELVPLPPDSVLMVTGGFKGRAHTLSDHELYAEALRRLQPSKLLTEYGMTELSSQLWATPGEPYAPPPWLRVVAVDPISTQPVPTEAPGQLRFYDLCNLDSTLGVETMDEGIVHADGRVTLIGRLTDAPTRGCSLTVEEAWLARRSS